MGFFRARSGRVHCTREVRDAAVFVDHYNVVLHVHASDNRGSVTLGGLGPLLLRVVSTLR